MASAHQQAGRPRAFQLRTNKPANGQARGSSPSLSYTVARAQFPLIFECSISAERREFATVGFSLSILPLWCVCVTGVDDVLPQPSQEHRMGLCHTSAVPVCRKACIGHGTILPWARSTLPAGLQGAWVAVGVAAAHPLSSISTLWLRHSAWAAVRHGEISATLHLTASCWRHGTIGGVATGEGLCYGFPWKPIGLSLWRSRHSDPADA